MRRELVRFEGASDSASKSLCERRREFFDVAEVPPTQRVGVADLFLGIGTFGAAFEECGGAVTVRCKNNSAADQVAALRAGGKSVNTCGRYRRRKVW